MHLQIATRQVADATIAMPTGRIDHAKRRDVRGAVDAVDGLKPSGKALLVLDFSGIEYISSVGLRTLMIAARQMREGEAKIGIAALQPVVAEIIAISRFDRVLSVFPSVRDALQAFSGPALTAFDAASE